MTRIRVLMIFALAGIFAAGGAGAQALTGSLTGTAKDESGGVLPGATATVASAALIGGPWTASADDRGHFRFPSLAPGLYSLEIQLANFTTYREEGIRVD